MTGASCLLNKSMKCQQAKLENISQHFLTLKGLCCKSALGSDLCRLRPWVPSRLWLRPSRLSRGLHLLRGDWVRPVRLSAPGLRLRPQRRGPQQLLSVWRRVQGLHLPASLPPRLRLWPRGRLPVRLLLRRDGVCPVSVSAPGLWLRPHGPGPWRLLSGWWDLQRLQVWEASPSGLWVRPGVWQPGLPLSGGTQVCRV